MSGLTSELNLITPDGDDDTADFLDISLEQNLRTLDGLFAAGTGHAHFGAHNGAPINPANFPDGSIPASKLAAGTIAPEALYAGTFVSTAVNYTVAATVMYVFCTAAVTVTLPAAVSTNRPITVVAVSGQSNVASAGGSVFGGSANTTTGAVMNGVVVAPESFTYKSDGANWRTV